MDSKWFVNGYQWICFCLCGAVPSHCQQDEVRNIKRQTYIKFNH